MRGSLLGGSFVAVMFAVACGASNHPAESPENATPSVAPEEDRASSAVEKPSKSDSDSESDDHSQRETESKPSKSAKNADVPTPDFKPNGSVADAVNAIPQGTPRLNIEQEALGRPLGNVELYEACKPGSSHFKARVAVWDGKAVGLDLSTTPKNAKFAECVAEKIRGITWPDKVKSLNIVEYTY